LGILVRAAMERFFFPPCKSRRVEMHAFWDDNTGALAAFSKRLQATILEALETFGSSTVYSQLLKHFNFFILHFFLTVIFWFKRLVRL
jgi:hypothetical protein